MAEVINQKNEILPMLMRIAAVVATVAAVVFISVVPQVSNDFWLQVKVGQLIAESHSIPQTILFTFTEAKDVPFNAHEWLPSVLFYWLLRGVGEDALPLVMGFGGIVFFAIAALIAYQRSGGNLFWSFVWGLMAVCVENQRHYLRPELVSLMLLGLYWYILERCRSEPHKARWLSAWVIVVVWTNSHGSFILAPIISTTYAVGIWIDTHWPGAGRKATAKGSAQFYFAFTVAAFIATLINPKGIELWRFVLDFGHADSTKQMVAEWLPTFDPRWWRDRGFWIGIACASVTATMMAVHWRKLSAVDVLLFLLFTTLAVQAIRFLVYLGMLSAYVIPSLMPKAWGKTESRTRAYGFLAIASVLALGLSMRFGNAMGSFPHTAFEANYSLSAPMVAQLNNPLLHGNVLNSYELGAELVYRAYPRLRPSIDSRIDSYGKDWTALNSQLFVDDDLLKKFVTNYDVRYMLLSHDDFISLKRLSSWSEGLWKIIAMDRRTVLLLRG